MRSAGRVIGVRGASWRATVDALGTVHPHDGSRELAWHVAGDDRWYSPGTESTVRQKWYSGYPVAETRMRVGTGDIVQRIWCTADDGGLTVVEFENDTPATVAVAVTRSDVLSSRDLGRNPPQGIDLPEGSVVLPLAHRSTTRIALRHAGAAAGPLPADLPGHQQVVRGWETACDVASRIVLPDHTVVAGICRVRSDLLLGADLDDDASAIELVRLGETHLDSIIEVVESVNRRLKAEKKSRVLAWDTPHLLATAARACVVLDDETAAGDVASAWARLADRDIADPPLEVPAGIAAVAWAESLIARGTPEGGTCSLFPWGVPPTWWGANFEAHGLVAGPHHAVSLAVRWHGERPALLWEVTGERGLLLTGGVADPSFTSVETSGEALLAAPVRA